MAAMIIETKIENLVPDDLNANKGTEYGQHLIENSLRKFGAGRSILIDRNNRIIAGNKTIENAANIGLDNVIVVETDGNQIVAVKRKDIDLSHPEEEEEKEDVKKELSTKLVVQCPNVSQLSLLYSELQDRGFICELKE